MPRIAKNKTYPYKSNKTSNSETPLQYRLNGILDKLFGIDKARKAYIEQDVFSLATDSQTAYINYIEQCITAINSAECRNFAGLFTFYDSQRDWSVTDPSHYDYLDESYKEQFTTEANAFRTLFVSQIHSFIDQIKKKDDTSKTITESLDFYRNKVNNGYKPEGDESRFDLASEKFTFDDDISGRRATACSGAGFSGCKPAQNYVKNSYLELLRDTSTYALFITCNVVNDEVNIGSSWDLIKERRDKLVKLLSDTYPDLVCCICGIEEFTGTKAKPKDKTKTKPPKQEEKEDSDDEEEETDTDPIVIECKVYKVPSEAKQQEVIYFFSQFDSKGNKSEAATKQQVLERLIEFLLSFSEIRADSQASAELTSLSTASPLHKGLIPEYYYSVAYDLLAKLYGYYPENSASDKASQKGYAHLHMTAFFKKTGSKEVTNAQVDFLIQKAGLFLDMSTEKYITNAKAKKGAPVQNKAFKTPIAYCLKNSRHRTPFIRLGFENPCTFHNVKNDHTFNKYFYDLLNAQKVNIILDGVVIPEKIPMTPTKKAPLPTVIGASEDTKLCSTDHLSDKSLTKRVIEFVNQYLFDNNLAFCNDGFIYKKCPGSRNTYVIYNIQPDNVNCTPNHLYQLMLNTETGLEFFLNPKVKRIYDEIAKTELQRFFTKIYITCEWIEFKDFFVHVPTKKIIKEQYKWPAYVYISDCSLETLEKMQSYDKSVFPTLWLQILQNSDYVDSLYKPIDEPEIVVIGVNELTGEEKTMPSTVTGQMFVNDTYKLLSPQTQKTKTCALSGGANAAKTTVIAPFIKLLPSNKVGTVANAGTFTLTQFIDKQLIILDEMSLKSTGMCRSSFLPLLERNAMVAVNRKGLDPYNAIIRACITILSNDNRWAMVHPDCDYPTTFVPQIGAHIDNAYLARINFYNFKPLPNPKSGAKEIIERKERGKVFLYLLAFSNHRDIEYIDTIEEMEEIIDNYNHQKDIRIDEELF